MKSSKYTFFVALLSFGMTFLFSSCKKDIEGCMDVTAENFNADANVDNGLCVYARDKFLGTFAGSLSCQAPLPNDEEFTISFTESLNDISEVEILIQNTMNPVPVLFGTVNGNLITIQETSASVPLDTLRPNDLIDVVFSGEATLDATETNLSGELRILVQVFNQTLKCDLMATKQ